jgi:hypothetical protein
MAEAFCGFPQSFQANVRDAYLEIMPQLLPPTSLLIHNSLFIYGLFNNAPVAQTIQHLMVKAIPVTGCGGP